MSGQDSSVRGPGSDTPTTTERRQSSLSAKREEPLLREDEPSSPLPQADSASSSQQREDMERFMSSATRRASDGSFDLRQGFYDESQTPVSRHHLDDQDVSRHRSSDFPHAQRPLALRRKTQDKKKSSKKAKEKAAEEKFTPQLSDVQEGSSQLDVADGATSGSQEGLREVSSAPHIGGVSMDSDASVTPGTSEIPEVRVVPATPQAPALPWRATPTEVMVDMESPLEELAHMGEEAPQSPSMPRPSSGGKSPVFFLGAESFDGMPIKTAVSDSQQSADDLQRSDSAIQKEEGESQEEEKDLDLQRGETEPPSRLDFLRQLSGPEVHPPVLSPSAIDITSSGVPGSPQPVVSFLIDEPYVVVTGSSSDLDVEHKVSPEEAKKAKKPKGGRIVRPSTGELAKRRTRGSEVKLDERLTRVPTELEEALGLGAADLDNIAIHRLGDTRGNRRKISKHSALASVVHIGRSEKGVPKDQKKTPDHQPHEMFVELDELYFGGDEEWCWEEKARWIKYEEDVEEGAERWGKPHVASLSFHSLLELRKCIEQGAILLDLMAEDLPAIANAIVEQLVLTDQLDAEDKGVILKALLLKHRHVNEKKSSNMKRNIAALNLPYLSSEENVNGLLSSKNSLSSSKSFKSADRERSQSFGLEVARRRSQSLGVSASNKSVKSAESNGQPTPDVLFVSGGQSMSREAALNISMASVMTPSTERKQQQSNILRCIPEGSESTTVLIGSVDFLKRPVMAFVRLSEGRFLGNLTELPLPVRFLFLLMGPENSNMDYHEIGRSISTLMADKRFHDMAYWADGRNDLLDAINEFLDDSLVLPPGEWGKKTLLPIMDMARKKMMKKVKRREEEEEKKALIEPSTEKDLVPLIIKEAPVDPLRRTGRLFGGLINDVKRRYPKYLSDLKDGLNVQCLATFFFIYFACLSPAITFGGLLGEKVDKWMGVSEMLVVTCLCGVLFSLLSCQPLVIIGATGPVIVFEQGLYQICESLDLEFLPMRAWVGMWITFIAVLMVMFDGSFLVRFFTRFVEEIFASLISLIFIYEVFAKLAKIFKAHPLQEYYLPPLDLNDTGLEALAMTVVSGVYSTAEPLNISIGNHSEIIDPKKGVSSQPNTALLSLILTFGTFLIAYSLKNFRNSKFLARQIRRALGDFGVPIAISTMVLVDYLIKDTYTEKLDVPDGFSVTDPKKRGWVINPLGEHSSLPYWAIPLAAVPAMLCFILIFMETQITSMIINKKERKLLKGSGYHSDLLVIGMFGTISGVMGLPFLCSATVRAVSHVSALSVYSRTNAPGEKPQMLGVIEQRVTAFAVHVMIGVSILLGPVLRQIPLAVLFGIFLYMGIASMSGIQFLERVEMLFMPVKHHPQVGYVRRVRTFKMHMFTGIQLLGLAILWVVKSTKAALAFPFVLLLLVPVRMHVLRFLFSPRELKYLDAEEVDEGDSEEEDEPDFFTQAHMPM